MWAVKEEERRRKMLKPEVEQLGRLTSVPLDGVGWSDTGGGTQVE